MLPELTEVEYLKSVWQALRRIESSLAAGFQAPVVNVPDVDLSDVVNAVVGIHPGPTAQEIAEALASIIAPGKVEEGGNDSLHEVAEALKKLEFRLQGLGTQAYGGGSVSFSKAGLAQLSDAIAGGPGGAAGGLTDEELRATPVSVTMTGSPTGGLTDAELRATPVPISGTVNLGTIDGAATEGTLADALAALTSIATKLDSQIEAGDAVALDVATLAALETTNVGNFPSTYPVTDNGGSLTVDGTFWQATQPVSLSEPISVDDNGGSLTVDNAQLSVVGGGTEAAALRVTLANDSTGVVSIDDNGASLTVDGPVTDAQLRATPIEVTMTGSPSGGLTDTELRATPVPVSGTVAATLSEPISIDDNGSSITVDNAQLSVVGGGTEAAAMRVTIANDSTGVLSVDDNGGSLTVDGTFWQATQPVSGTFWQATQPISGTVTVNEPVTVDGTVALDSATLTALETITIANPTTNPETGLAKDATLTGGTAKAIVRAGAKGATAAADVTSTSIDVDHNGLDVKVAGTVPVSGTFWQATQPVSGTFWQATQPVSGTVTASGPVTDAQLRATPVPVSGTVTVNEPVSIDDNGASLTVDNATISVVGSGTEATAQRVTIATDSTGVLSVDDNGGSLTVDGTFWQATQPVSGPVTDAQLRASAVPVSLASVPSHAVTGTFWQATQPVSGTFWQATQPVSFTQPALVAGTANIGDVDVLTLPALPAGTNNIGDVDVLTLPAENRPATGTLANVASSATSVTLQASNAARRGFMVHNDSTAILYVKYGTTASATSYTVKLQPDAYYEMAMPIYTGRIDGIWAAANGNARVTELT